jgi:hypothetical protein
MKFKLTPNKRSSAPGNTTEKIHKLAKVVTISVNFSCSAFGVEYKQLSRGYTDTDGTLLLSPF